MAFTATAMTLPNFRQATAAGTCPESKPAAPNQLSLPSELDSEQPQQSSRKLKGSPQLNRWSRARAIRYGRKLDRPVQKAQPTEAELGLPTVRSPDNSSPNSDNYAWTGRDGDDDVEATAGKQIYMVSDGTGWTAEHTVNAALEQFEHCLVDRGCPVNTHLFSGVIMPI